MTSILTFNSHETYVHDLARMGHPMDVVVDLPGHHVEGWDERMRPVPHGVRLISLEEARASRYACVIGHTITDLLAVRSLPGARIFVAHGSLAGRIAQEQAQSDPQQVAATLRHYLEAVGGIAVAVSEMKRESWRLDAKVIRAGIEPNEYGGYRGEVASGLRVANHISQKSRVLRFELHEQIFGEALPCRLVGVNPDRPGIAPAPSWDALRTLYRSHRFFVHTAEPGLEDGYNLASLEAMATGMPGICNAHPSCPVEDGVSGFVSDDPEVLRRGVRQLLDDPQLARRMGAAARRSVRERFPMTDFVAGWRAVVEQSLARQARSDRPRETRHSPRGRP